MANLREQDHVPQHLQDEDLPHFRPDSHGNIFSVSPTKVEL